MTDKFTGRREFLKKSGLADWYGHKLDRKLLELLQKQM